jgi:amino acid transporter
VPAWAHRGDRGVAGLPHRINIIGVRSAARTGVVLVIGKMLPLLLFVAIGAFYIDRSCLLRPRRTRTTCSAWARPPCCCCTPTPASRTSRPPPASTAIRARYSFALITMIITVTVIYGAVQVVAQGTLAGLSARPRRWPMPPPFGGEGWR